MYTFLHILILAFVKKNLVKSILLPSVSAHRRALLRKLVCDITQCCEKVIIHMLILFPVEEKPVDYIHNR